MLNLERKLMLERVSLIQPNQIKAPDSSRVITYLNLDWNQPIKGTIPIKKKIKGTILMYESNKGMNKEHPEPLVVIYYDNKISGYSFLIKDNLKR